MTDAKAGDGAAPPARRCPTCGKPDAPAYTPFCSKRCADVDLHRWLSGSYAIPVSADDDDDADGSGASLGRDEDR